MNEGSRPQYDGARTNLIFGEAMKPLALLSVRLVAVRTACLIALVATFGGPWAAGVARAQSCADLPGFAETPSAQLRAELAQVDAALSQADAALAEGRAFLAANPDEAESFREGFASTAGMSWEEAIAQIADSKSRLPLVRACIQQKEAQERAGPQAGPSEPEPRQLVPIQTGPGADLQIPCVLRDQICTDLQGNPTGRSDAATQGGVPVEPPGGANAGPGQCGDLGRAEIQDLIAQGQRTITALRQSRGQVSGDEAEIEARIAEIMEQIAGGQAALDSCSAQ